MAEILQFITRTDAVSTVRSAGCTDSEEATESEEEE